MAFCVICGETHPDYFDDERDYFCDRCSDLMNYWFKEAFNDIKTVAQVQKGKEYRLMDFAEAVEAYGNERWKKEYDRNKNGENK